MCSEGKKQTNKHTFWNSGLFLSADLLPETESRRDELFFLLFTRRRCGRLHSRAPHVDVWIWKARTARGRDRIRYNGLRRENWTSHQFHTDYFNIEYFGRNLLHLKVDILSFLYIYFSCIWGEYSWRFRLFYLRVCEERWQSRQRTHPVYFINFRKAHYFVVIMTIQK